jgi:hypothetical protein
VGTSRFAPPRLGANGRSERQFCLRINALERCSNLEIAAGYWATWLCRILILFSDILNELDATPYQGRNSITLALPLYQPCCRATPVQMKLILPSCSSRQTYLGMVMLLFSRRERAWGGGSPVWLGGVALHSQRLFIPFTLVDDSCRLSPNKSGTSLHKQGRYSVPEGMREWSYFCLLVA